MRSEGFRWSLWGKVAGSGPLRYGSRVRHRRSGQRGIVQYASRSPIQAQAGAGLAEVHSEWEIYRARLRSLECREPALKFSDEVRSQIGIDITGYRGAVYKQFDDLLDGILCAYLAYYYWCWGEEGSWVVGDMATGYVTCHGAD